MNVTKSNSSFACSSITSVAGTEGWTLLYHEEAGQRHSPTASEETVPMLLLL